MNPSSKRPSLVLVSLSFLVFAGSAIHASDPKACCRIIRVDEEKGTAWLRNPRTGLLAQFRLGPGDSARFKIGDQFDPDAALLNGQPIDRRYSMVVPRVDTHNARIIRVRGHEVAVEVTDSKTVYRFYTLKFGKVLSSIRPGEELLVDEAGRWAFVEVAGYAKVKPSVWAFRLD
jgi:hypothetical protein